MRRMYSEKQVKELARNEIENKDLDLKGDINLLEDKAIKSGDNSIIVNSQNDEIVLSGLVRADNDVEFEKDLSVDGDIAGANITGDSIIENMSGYYFTAQYPNNFAPLYAGAVKNGNKLTLIVSGTYKKLEGDTVANPNICSFTIPKEIYNKIIPYSNINVDSKQCYFFNTVSSGINKVIALDKNNNLLKISLRDALNNFVIDTVYYFRYEITFLLNNNLAE